jgi:multiple sugar transport system permease protein
MSRWLSSLAFVAAGVFCVGPVLWQLITSFGTVSESGSVQLRNASLQSYTSVLFGRAFVRSLLSSAAVAVATTVVSVALGTASAFALAKLPVRARGTLLAATLAASMLPPIAAVSPLYLLIRALGLRDQLAGLVLPYTGFALPLVIWVLSDYFARLPHELYRAAVVDGCSPWQAFALVYLPLSGPGLATAAILAFVFSWNEFLFALTFTVSPEVRTVPVAIALFAAEHREPRAEIAAASMIAALPLVALTLAFQRRVVEGLTAGAVKG